MAKREHEDERPDTEELRCRVGDCLRQHYRPASSARDASDFLPTLHLHHRIEQHSPGLVPIDQLRDALLHLGFKEERIGDEFMWLVMAV